MKKKYIIIGSSAAAIAAMQTLGRLDEDCEIICITASSQMPYNTCLLADYLAESRSGDDLYLLNSQYFNVNKISLYLNTVVKKICVEKNIVYTQQGQEFSYDQLLLAVGSSPIKMDIKDKIPACLAGIFYLATLEDVKKVKSYIKNNKTESAVVIGAGLSGLEFANSLSLLGLEVTIVEKEKNILNKSLDEAASLWLKDRLGIKHKIICNGVIQDYFHFNKKITGIKISGRIIDTQLIIFALGCWPNIDLAKSAGIICDRAIVVNNFMMTNIPNIYAAGDCCQVINKSAGLAQATFSWAESSIQGIVAANSMCGVATAYNGFLPFVVCSLAAMKIVFCGIIDYSGEFHRVVHKDNYAIFFIADKILCGFILMGNFSNVGLLRSAVLQKKYFCLDDYL